MNRYREEIDGLRALAVTSVIFFHLDVSMFKGGYVGVDIFFVISGYLVTTILLTQRETKSLSLTNFFERRCRRILPALLLTISACLPLSWLLVLPSDLRDFSLSAASASLFVSNYFFLFDSGYFDSQAELKPLLHTWSLAIEGQFYLLIACFALLSRHYGNIPVLKIFSLIILISFVFSQWSVHSDPNLAFFSFPTRFWELGIGSMIAFYDFNFRKNRFSQGKLSGILSSTGLLLIIASVASFHKRHPYARLPSPDTHNRRSTHNLVFKSTDRCWKNTISKNNVTDWCRKLQFISSSSADNRFYQTVFAA